MHDKCPILCISILFSNNINQRLKKLERSQRRKYLIYKRRKITLTSNISSVTRHTYREGTEIHACYNVPLPSTNIKKKKERILHLKMVSSKTLN
jgi:hypothetical protein